MKARVKSVLVVESIVEVDYLPADEASQQILEWPSDNLDEFTKALMNSIFGQIYDRNSDLNKVIPTFIAAGASIRRELPGVRIYYSPCLELMPQEEII